MNNYNKSMVETDMIKSFAAFADLEQPHNEPCSEEQPALTSFGEFAKDADTFPAV